MSVKPSMRSRRDAPLQSKLLPLAISSALALASTSLQAQTVAFDLVGDQSQGLTSFSVATAGGTDPATEWGPGDWFGVAAYGSWPQAAGVPFAIADDSVVGISGGAFAGDTQGIIDSSVAPTDRFLSMVDTVNGANPGNSATATWVFDVQGAAELAVSIDMAAMGDFESSDTFVWTWSLDGGPTETLFELAVNEDGSQVYTMEGGAMPELNDPLTLNGTTLSDAFTTFSATLPSTGSMLTIEFTGNGDGGSEAYAARNLIVSEGAINPGGPAVVLNEVLGSNTGVDNEFIELYNAGTSAVSIGGWSIELWDSDAGSSFGGADAGSPYIIPPDTVIEPGGFYLLATENAVGAFGESADLELPSNAIENGSYTIILVQGNGDIADSVYVRDSGPDDIANRAGEAFEPNLTIGPDGNFLPAGFFRADEMGVAQDGGPALGQLDFFLSDPAPTPMNSGLVQAPAIPLTIMEIQGAGHLSPFVGERVITSGVVTAVDRNGFYLQDPAGDANIATSDAIFVFTGGAPTVAVGDDIEISAAVSEFRPGSQGLSTTQLSAVEDIVTNMSGVALPAPIVVGANGRTPPTVVIDDDAAAVGLASINVETDPLAVFDPVGDGLDFYESLEGMLTRIESPLVVGSKRVFGSGGPGNEELYVAPDMGAAVSLPTVFGGARISADDFNPEIQVISNRISDVGDYFTGESIAGPIDAVVSYNFGKFLFITTSDIADSGETFVPETTTVVASGSDEITIASFNVLNLDPEDEENGQFTNLANIIVNNMQSPDIIGLQEIQDNSGPTDDGVVSADLTLRRLANTIRNAGGPRYRFIEIPPLDLDNGGQPGGNIRVAYLYNPKRVRFAKRKGADATTANSVIKGARGPRLLFNPGYVDPENEAFAGARKPLAAEFRANGKSIFVINNHFSSKFGDDPLFGPNQAPILFSEPERTDQATVVASFVSDILAMDADARVVVLGDLNEFEFRTPLLTLETAGLINLTNTADVSDAYSFIFNGNSQALDHILVSPSLFPAEFDAVHAAIDAAEDIESVTSDHDPIIVKLDLSDD
ncbi:MAG: lamin tail domain-containing protein [Pseudomonadota bacterium]